MSEHAIRLVLLLLASSSLFSNPEILARQKTIPGLIQQENGTQKDELEEIKEFCKRLPGGAPGEKQTGVIVLEAPVFTLLSDASGLSFEHHPLAPMIEASSPGDAKTLCYIRETTEEAGKYSGGEAAYRFTWDVFVVRWPERQLMDKGTFTGDLAYSTVKGQPGYGPRPEDWATRYLLSLVKTPHLFHAIDSTARYLSTDDFVESVNFSPDGSLFCFGTGNGSRIFRLKDDAQVMFLKGDAEHISFSPDGQFLASSSGYDGMVSLWDALTGQPLKTWKAHKEYGNDVTFSKDGKTFVSAGGDNMIHLWTAPGGELVRTLDAQSWVESVAFSPDGSLLAASDRDRKIKIWSTESWLLSKAIEVPFIVESVAFSPSGKELACGGLDGAFIWSIEAGAMTKELPIRWVRSVDWSPDGKMIATGDDSGALKLWDCATGNLIREMPHHGDWVFAVAFSKDGKWLASGSSDGTARVWPLE
jgi:WD40 repeat protein